MDIERLFKMSALQRTRTGRQVCHCLEEETECDQDLSRALIARCFCRECSFLCGGSETGFVRGLEILENLELALFHIKALKSLNLARWP